MLKTLKTKQAKTKVKKLKVELGLTIPVYGLDGKEKGVLALPKEIFSLEANPKLLAQYVRVYLANRRQGNASTKTRGEVTGSTRKFYRQKGTGRARHGDIKAPIFIGGGVVGGPKHRDFSLKLNKKQVRKSLFSAFTLKFKGKEILGINDDFVKMESKTKKLAGFLKSIGLESKRVLLTVPKMEKSSLVLAARNLPNVQLLDSASLNAYDVLNNSAIIFSKEALEVLKQKFLKGRQTSQKNVKRSKHENK